MTPARKELSCDILIAGGGIGGLICAVETKENRPDLDVLIIEKQFAGYGGKANKGGGMLQYFELDRITPMDFLNFHVHEIGAWLGDQELMLKYVNMNHEMLEKLDGWGVVLPRDEQGNYKLMPTGPFTSMICVDLDLCLRMRKAAERLGVRILDKTALAKLYVRDNRICGAAAYSILDDGTFYTIQAKKVIMATGSQNYRMGSMWSSGRGDGIAVAYYAGAEMRNAEFGNFSQLVHARSHNEVVFGENFMYNAKNEHITKNFTDKRQTDIPSTAVREWYLQMMAGNGPIHLDYGPQKKDTKVTNTEWKRDYGQKFTDLKHGYTARTDPDLEVVPMLIGELSCIRVGHDMQTSVDGLYAIGDCSYCGSAAPGAVPAPPGRNRGSGILNAVFAGIVCGRSLAKASMEAVPSPSEEEIENTFAALYAPLSRTEGHTAKDVIALVQQAMAPAEYSVYMKDDRMTKAEALIEQALQYSVDLKAKDMHDLLACHEARAMVLCAQMHYFAARERKESRGWFLREDYPEMDNANWLKWIILQYKDGRMTLRTEDIPIESYPIQPAADKEMKG